MKMHLLARIKSKNNVSINLTQERWFHIIESHDYMAGYLGYVIETIEKPDCIVRGWTDELLAVKYYEKTHIHSKYLIVVYKELPQESGFVITAFMTSEKDKFLRRGITWQKR